MEKWKKKQQKFATNLFALNFLKNQIWSNGEMNNLKTVLNTRNSDCSFNSDI